LLHLSSFTAPDPPEICTLSLHDALPICLEVRQAGQIIGEMALIDPSPRSATVRALTGSHVAILGEQAFTALMQRNPELMFDMLRSEEHTSELQSRGHLVCRLLLEKKKNK